MKQVLVGLLVSLTVIDVLLVVLAVFLRTLRRRLDTISESVLQLQKCFGGAVQGPIPNGRGFPTPEELANARNRMDRTGVAHPGGWQVPRDPDRPA